MSLTYGFYNALNHDRQYDAVQMSSIFDGIIKDGIFMSIGDHFNVTAGTGMVINVAPGRAWFNHTWTLNDAILPLEMEEPEVVLDRIDALVLEVNSEVDVRANDIKFIKGTPSSQPVKPDLKNTLTVHQYPLAYVTVKAGSSEIVQSNIENVIGTEQTPYITGILDTISADELIQQWRAEYKEVISADQSMFNTWYLEKKGEFADLYINTEDECKELIASVDSSLEANQERFETWLVDLQNELTENQAANLQRQINEINTKIDNNKLVHVVIKYDSSLAGAVIKLQNGVEEYNLTANTSGFNAIDCISLGEWTVSESKYGTSNTFYATYYGNYEAYVGGKVFINVTYDDVFIGNRIILTNGIKEYSRLASSFKTVQFVVAEHDTWTAKTTYAGQEYESSIYCPTDGEYTLTLRKSSFDFRQWVTSAGIMKIYSNLTDLLNDEDSVRTLMTSKDAIQYLIDNSLVNVSGDVVNIFNSNYGSKWINLRPYAFDKFFEVETLKEIMNNADKFGYGELVEKNGVYVPKGNVPQMTSNTVPFGIASDYRVFDKNNSTSATGTDFSYKSVKPICVKKFDCDVSGGVLQGSNDGVTYQNIGDVNVKYYLYHRVHFASSKTVKEIQFYGRELTDQLKTPDMTAETEPWGDAGKTWGAWSSSGDYGFYGSIQSAGPQGQETSLNYNPDVHYAWFDFGKLVTPISFDYLSRIHWYTDSSMSIPVSVDYKSFKLFGSVDNSTWELILDMPSITTQRSDQSPKPINVQCNPEGKKFRYFKFTPINGSSYSWPVSYVGLTKHKIYCEEADYIDYDDRHYIYDHGVEVQSLGSFGGIVTKNSSDIRLVSQESDYGRLYFPTNLTPYKKIRCEIHNISDVTDVNKSIYICAENEAFTPISSDVVTQSMLPDNISHNISNIDTRANATIKAYNTGFVDVASIWLE